MELVFQGWSQVGGREAPWLGGRSLWVSIPLVLRLLPILAVLGEEEQPGRCMDGRAPLQACCRILCAASHPQGRSRCVKDTELSLDLVKSC